MQAKKKNTIVLEIEAKNCTICGNEFLPNWYSQTMCSDECKKKAKSGYNRKRRESQKVLPPNQ